MQPTSSADDDHIVFIAGPHGVEIPVRAFARGTRSTPVVLTHGLQSHSGWFLQSAERISALGLPVYLIDRRGSGLSEAPRGECRDFQEMIEDIAAVARAAMAEAGTSTFHMLGHCFGAIPAAAFACAHPELIATLILATPGIHTKTDMSFAQKLQIFWSKLSGRSARLPVPLESSLFSELPEYVRFIEGDALSLEDATASFYFEVMRARMFIGKHHAKLAMPVFMACSIHDPICDNQGNKRLLEKLPSPDKRLEEYEARHVLEFSPQKEAFFDDLGGWLVRHTPSQPS